MRMSALVLTVLLAAPFVTADGGADARDVVENLVLDPRCPGYAQPATIACFDATGATAAHIVAHGPGNAQPRMLVQLQNATVQWSVHWLCEDRRIGWGAENVTQVVVSLHADRAGCGDQRLPLLTGTLRATMT